MRLGSILFPASVVCVFKRGKVAKYTFGILATSSAVTDDDDDELQVQRTT